VSDRGTSSKVPAILIGLVVVGAGLAIVAAAFLAADRRFEPPRWIVGCVGGAFPGGSCPHFDRHCVLNPEACVNCAGRATPSAAVAPIVTRIWYVVPELKGDAGEIVKVVFPELATGAAAI
jgi:hypothetical protein